VLADSSDFGLLGEQSSTKMGDSQHFLPWTPINRRAKFDAASFILGGEIRNQKKQTQTVNERENKFTKIVIPCLGRR